MTWVRLSAIQRRTLGTLVHMAKKPLSGEFLDVGMPLKEGWRHGPRLVQVKIDPDAEPEGVLHQGVEPLQAFFPALAEFRKLRGGGPGC